MEYYKVLKAQFYRGGLNLTEDQIVGVDLTKDGASIYHGSKKVYFFDFSNPDEKNKFESWYEKLNK